jgi:hypothetical protein
LQGINSMVETIPPKESTPRTTVPEAMNLKKILSQICYLGKGPHERAVHSHQLLVGQHVPLVQDNPDLDRKSQTVFHWKNDKVLRI